MAIYEDNVNTYYIEAQQYREDWLKYADQYPKKDIKYYLRPSDLGRCFVDRNSKVFRIIGLKKRNPVRPVVARCLNNDRDYYWPATGVAMRLALNAAPEFDCPPIAVALIGPPTFDDNGEE